MVDWMALRAAAGEASRNAYAPYSGVRVGAAGLVSDGRVLVGCNVENASYGLALCAECGVVSALHANGGGQLVAVACVDGAGAVLMPCGRCRQLLWEHGGPDCLVDSPRGPARMEELLAHPFDRASLVQSAASTAGAADDGAVGAGASPATPNDVPPQLIEYLGKGTVFIHRDVVAGHPTWTGYWERASNAGEASGILEEAPNWPDVVDAIGWARTRTPRVVVVEADGSMAWAGAGDPPTPDLGRFAPVGSLSS